MQLLDHWWHREAYNCFDCYEQTTYFTAVSSSKLLIAEGLGNAIYSLPSLKVVQSVGHSKKRKTGL